MRRLLKTLLERDKHGDSPLSFLVFAVTFVGMLLVLSSLPGY